MSWVFRRAERLWEVGYYTPTGQWQCLYDDMTKDDAAEMVHYLNGGS